MNHDITEIVTEKIFEDEAKRVQAEIDHEYTLSDEDNKCGIAHRNFEEKNNCETCK